MHPPTLNLLLLPAVALGKALKYMGSSWKLKVLLRDGIVRAGLAIFQAYHVAGSHRGSMHGEDARLAQVKNHQ
jgi:hypothetical protein